MTIAIIRLRGEVGMDEPIEQTLFRLGLKRKFSCVIIREVPEKLGMLRKVENFVTYGQINKETLIELIKNRGKAINKEKIDAEKIATEFLEGKTEKDLGELGLKPVFRLHPPRKGFKSIKLHYPKGDLGKHPKINELIRRML